MIAESVLFDDLQRMHINGLLKDIPRGNEKIFDTPLSTQWLRVNEALVRQANGWEKAKEWQTILRGISRTAAIVYGAKGYRVVFDEADEIYDKFSDKQAIVVSTAPVRDPAVGVSLYHAVDVMMGQVIHEAAHLFERQGDAAPFGDDRIMTPLYHLAEDVIIDAIIALQYPGFAGYLLKFRRYLVDLRLRKMWGNGAGERLKHLILSVRSTRFERIDRHSVKLAYLYLIFLLGRYPTVVELRRLDRVRLAQQLYAILYETKQADQWKDPGQLAESLVFGADGPPTPGTNGSNRGGDALRPVNSQTAANGEASDQQSLDLPTLDAPKAKTLSKLLAGNRWQGEYCHERRPGGNERSLSAEELQMVRKMEDNAQTFAEGKGAGQKTGYRVIFSRPPLQYHAAERYRAAVDAVRGQIVLLRNQFAWANAGINCSQFGLTAGELDEDALYRAKYAADLFSRPVVLPRRTQNLDIAMLVDISHSMLEPVMGSGQPGYIVAQRLAALFVEALEAVESIETWVYSFTSVDHVVDIRELFAPDAKADKARIGDIYPAHQTPEYQALLSVSERMREVSRPGVKKVYIVFSDGLPQDDLTPGPVQTEKIRSLVRKLRAGGDHVIHVALSPGAQPQQIYPHCLTFPEKGYPELVKRFGKMLESLLQAL